MRCVCLLFLLLSACGRPSNATPEAAPAPAPAAVVEPVFAGHYEFEDAVPGGPGSPQALVVKVSLRRDAKGYLGVVTADGFQTARKIIVRGEVRGSELALIVMQDVSEIAGATLATGTLVGTLGRDQRAFVLTITDGPEPGRFAAPSGTKKLRVDRASPQDMRTVDPEPPRVVVDVVPGVSLGPVRVGMTRAELSALGSVQNDPSGQLGKNVQVLGPYFLTLANDVVTTVEMTPSENDTGVRIGNTLLTASTSFEDALVTLGSCKREPVLDSVSATCKNGLVLKNAMRCTAHDAAGKCLWWERGQPVLAIRIVKPTF